MTDSHNTPPEDDRTRVAPRAGPAAPLSQPATSGGATVITSGQTSVSGLAAQTGPTIGAGGKGASHEAGLLPVGSRLAEFEITRVVGQGGFGVVYEAWDHTLERVVAIKEYLPSSLSTRQGDGTVVPLSERHRETFDLGMRSFINEARLLAQFDHPSLLKVYRFWQERGTTYMVMPFYRGDTLRQSLAAVRAGVDEGWLVRIMDGVTQALGVMHNANCYHRDIAPDNIILLEGSGRPVVLDFGAARRVITDKTQAITVILKPGYAPIEQYAEMPDMSQGAWTDVYALAAVMHVAVCGRAPPPSVARLLSDSYVPLASNAILQQRYSLQLLQAIDAGLGVRPEARPQSMGELRAALGLEVTTTLAQGAHSSGARTSGVATQPASLAQRTQPPTTLGKKKAKTVAPPPRPATAAQRGAAQDKSKTLVLAVSGVVVAAAMAAGGGWWWLQSRASGGGGGGTINTATPPVNDNGGKVANNNNNVSPPPNPNTGSNTNSDSGNLFGGPLVKGSTSLLAPTPPPPSPSPPPPAGPRTPAQSLQALSEGAAADFEVMASAKKPEVTIGKDKLAFEVRSKRDGYVYIYLLSSGGEMFLLFPNLLDKYNKISAGGTLALPRASWPMDSGGPPGTNQFAVLVSEHERDFSDAGVQNDGVFPQFPLPVLAALEAARGSGPSPLLGKPVCAPKLPCNDVYGVGTFKIVEK